MWTSTNPTIPSRLNPSSLLSPPPRTRRNGVPSPLSPPDESSWRRLKSCPSAPTPVPSSSNEWSTSRELADARSSCFAASQRAFRPRERRGGRCSSTCEVERNRLRKRTGEMVQESERSGMLAGWPKLFGRPVHAAKNRKNASSDGHAKNSSDGAAKDTTNTFVPTAAEGGIALYSPEFYMACAGGGVVSCGATHTAVTPLDVVKCNMQVRWRRDSARCIDRKIGTGLTGGRRTTRDARSTAGRSEKVQLHLQGILDDHQGTRRQGSLERLGTYPCGILLPRRLQIRLLRILQKVRQLMG